MGQILGLVQVDQSTVAIKETFGKFNEVLEPGCHFLPWCIGQQIAGYLSLRVQQLDVRCETKTKDNVFVTVVASVQYRALADKASDAFYKLSNTREQIQSYVFDGNCSFCLKLYFICSLYPCLHRILYCTCLVTSATSIIWFLIPTSPCIAYVMSVDYFLCLLIYCDKLYLIYWDKLYLLYCACSYF